LFAWPGGVPPCPTALPFPLPLPGPLLWPGPCAGGVGVDTGGVVAGVNGVVGSGATGAVVPAGVVGVLESDGGVADVSTAGSAVPSTDGEAAAALSAFPTTADAESCGAAVGPALSGCTVDTAVAGVDSDCAGRVSTAAGACTPAVPGGEAPETCGNHGAGWWLVCVSGARPATIRGIPLQDVAIAPDRTPPE